MVQIISNTMALSQDDLSIFEKKYAMYVLLAIDSNPMSTKTEILRLEEGNEKTKFIRIQEMIDLGLVEYRDFPDHSSKRLALTPEGASIVSKLKKLRLHVLKLNKTNNRDEPSEENADE